MSSLLVSSVIMRLSIGSGTLIIMLFVITSSMQSLYIMWFAMQNRAQNSEYRQEVLVELQSL